MAAAYGNGSVHPDRMLNINPAYSGDKAVVVDMSGVTFAGNDGGGHDGFDFGSGQPLPPSRHPLKQEPGYETRPTHNGAGQGESLFRSFSRYADTSLLDYLRGRNVSPYFLHEIDMFLAAHPEIAHYKPRFTSNINHLPMVDAYRFFMKGYTKPARYANGALPNLHSIPLPQIIVPTASMYGAELADFFDGYEYRTDILQKIDHEVARLANALYHGERVTFAQRRLVVYALYGNVADAFRYFEYCYQSEWLAHRYLPEHVVLSELPKQEGYTLPTARQTAHSDEGCQENRRSHAGPRARMAHANDSGVDVIEVLLDEFTAMLCRRGLRRPEIEVMRREAMRNIDHQRDTQGGRDIVDMVMNYAIRTEPADFDRKPKAKAIKRTAKLDMLARGLRCVLARETTLYADGLDLFLARENTMIRQRLERELVCEVTIRAAAAGTMSGREVTEWRAMYTPKEQEQREASGRRIDLQRELSRYLSDGGRRR